MKKWMYVIFPGAMLALFLVFFLSHDKEMKENEAKRAIAVKAQQDEDAAKKKVAEEKAHTDALQRAADRAKEDADKAAKKAAELAAKDKDVKDATDKALAEGDASAKTAANLEIELDRLHKQKAQLTSEAFDLAKQVELAKVARRAAEMNQQRTTAMIAQRANDGVLTRLPAALPPPPAAK